MCRAELTSLDVDTGETIIIRDLDLIIEETNITFTSQQLTENRRYNVTITASNIVGQTTTSVTMISTSSLLPLHFLA